MTRALLLLLAAAPAALVSPASAQQPAPLTIAAGTGRVLRLRAPAANIFTADPKVAEVRPASPDSVFVFGTGPGTTTVAALANDGTSVAQFQVTVTPSAFTAGQTADQLRAAAPKLGVRARETVNGVALSGTVATPLDAARTVGAATAQLPKKDASVVNALRVQEPMQVSLRVRIVEMSRTLTRELGVNWTSSNIRLGTPGSSGRFGIATNNPVVNSTITPSLVTLGLRGTSGNLDIAVQALAADQLVHTLAEPNLTAMSGEVATFLVGGEFPIPVSSSVNTVGVEFKQYGISLAFVPTVLNRNSISLKVRPEVSQLDRANGVTFFFGNPNTSTGLAIPGLIVRRAETTVQLGSGQSFVIAGLLQDQTTVTGNSVPWLGEVPILGSLFRSDSFQRGESELVIIVTPYIVQPVSDPNALKTPADGWRPPSDVERILYMRQSQPGWSGTRARRIPADAGFMVE